MNDDIGVCIELVTELEHVQRKLAFVSTGF
jgi:hypothetical protein